MNLQFNNYKIITDDRQFIVQERKEVQPSGFTKEENIGKKYWDNIGYFGNLKYVLRFLSKSILLKNDDLDVIIKELKQLEKSIDNFAKEFKEKK